MNREIKFRAWHETQQKMYSAEEMAADQLTLLPTGKFINVSGHDTRLSKIADDMIPLQFTGSFDKNGKEIYENDVIETNNFMGKTHFVVKFLTNVDSFGAFEPVHVKSFKKDASTSSVHCGATDECEIIGNVFENPELLK